MWSNCVVLEVKVSVKNVVLVFSDAFGIELRFTHVSSVQGDTEELRKPPVDLFPTVLAVGVPATAATYCPGRMTEQPKSKSRFPRILLCHPVVS